MKQLIFTSYIFFVICGSTFSQGFNYQAVLRATNGDVLANQLVQVRFTLFSADGSEVYTEDHTNVVTDEFGHINLVIGEINPGGFEAIPWEELGHSLQVFVDSGTGFIPFGLMYFQSVPYAKYATGMKLEDLGNISGEDADPGQVLTWNGEEWSPSADTDNQVLTINGNQLAISGGNAVTLPNGPGGGDNWGTQTIASDATLEGDGTLGSPLKFSQQNASNGQVLKWNGNQWSPAIDENISYSAGTGIIISSNTITNTGDTNPSDDITNTSQAGGDLSGTFSNLQLKSGSVGSNEITNGSIGPVDLAPGTVPSSLPPNGGAGGDLLGNYPNPMVIGLRGHEISDQTPVNGQVLKWDDGEWVPDNDLGTVYSAGTGISITGITINNTGDTNPSDDITNTSQAGGDLSGTFSNLQLKSGSVGSNEIANGSIGPVDLAPGTVPSSLPPNGGAGGDLTGNYPNPLVTGLRGHEISDQTPVNGQVLKWDDGEWVPDSDLGTVYSAGTGISITGSTIINTGDTNPSDDITNTSQAGGDLTGNFPNPVVTGLRGHEISDQTPVNGQVLKWDDGEWVPDNDQDGQFLSISGNELSITQGNTISLPAANGDITSVSAGTGLTGGGTSGGVTLHADHNNPIWNANKIKNQIVDLTSPESGQALIYDGSKFVNGYVQDNDWITIGTTDPLAFHLEPSLPVKIGNMELGVGVLPSAPYSINSFGALNLNAGLTGIALYCSHAEAIWYDGNYFSWGFGGNHNFFASAVGIGTTSPTHLLHVNGVARSSQSTWATSSDRRVKTNIQPLSNALSLISRFNPVTFNWKKAYKKDHPQLKEQNYGFIAQEAEMVIPEMVTHIKETVGEEEIEDFRVLNVDALIPLLVKGMQEQQALIESQQEQIRKLEERLMEVEASHSQN